MLTYRDFYAIIKKIEGKETLVLFIGLHNHSDHSNYRLRDSINKIENLIDYTHQLGHKGIAITEHETVGSTIEALKVMESRKQLEGWQDYKLILGNEIYLCSRKAIEEDKDYNFYHFILLAKDAIGHEQIRKLSTIAWMENSLFYVMQRVPTYYDNLIKVISENKGHVIGSSACLGGSLPHKILEIYANSKNPDYSVCEKWICKMKNIFGEENFFLELQPSDNEQQIIVNEVLIQLSKKTNTDYIITTDSHYLKKEDRKIHKAYLNSQEGDREVDDFYATTYVMSEEEIHSYMDKYLNYEEVQKGIDNTMKIYDMCENYEIRKPLKIPYIPDNIEEPNRELYLKYKDKVPSFEYFYNSKVDCDRHLLRELLKVLEQKPEEFDNIAIYDEMEVELQSIIKSSQKMNANWSGYLLQTAIFVQECWKSGTWVGPTRGCFTSNNKVLMGDGTQKNISEVQEGDMVYTHLGEQKRVLKKYEYEIEEELLQMEFSKNISITCTKEHQFYIKQLGPCFNPTYKQNWCSDIYTKCFNKKIPCPNKQKIAIGFKEAQQLNKYSLCSYPKIQLPYQTLFEIDLALYNPQAGINDTQIWNKRCQHDYQPLTKHHRYIKIDEEFAYFCGVFIGDGWTRSNKTEIGIAFSTKSEKEQKSLERIKNYVTNILGYKYSLIYNKNQAVVQFCIHSSLLANFFQVEFGKNAIEKHIPSFLWIDNYNLMQNLLEGLLASDGSYDKEHLKISYDSINFNLISQVQALFAFFGCRGGITQRIPKDKRKDFLNSKISYKVAVTGKQVQKFLSFLPEVKFMKAKQYTSNLHENSDACFFFRVPNLKILPKLYKGKVYDLQVEGTHSYVINGCSVHNSGGGFLLLYMLSITQVNPLRETTKTYHWRFLNPERVSSLDVDLDIIGSDKEKVLLDLKQKYGELHISKVQTLLTEKAKSALLTAARGIGEDNDIGTYLASFIKSERGIQFTLQQTFYGDEKNGIVPDKEFVRIMTHEYPEIWEVAQKIEGLINGVGSHAGGIILTEEPFYESTALMKTNTGDIITQFNLHDAEAVGLIKWDLLAIDALGREKTCLELLAKDHLIEGDGKSRECYEKYLGIYNIERNDPKMWQMVWNHQIMSLFQMEKQSGVQAIALVKPTSVDDLATINSVMRLMAAEGATEQPLERLARFKKDISLWYKEMTDYGLTQEEQLLLRKHLEGSYGICDSQEKFMMLVQEPQIGGFDLLWSDRLRRSIAKKSPKDFEQLEKEFFENQKEKNLSSKLCHYVWYVLIYMNRGYGFNSAHTLGYSLVGLQEMNLAYKYPIIYWNTANLIVDSGGLDNSGTNYGKIAKAIGDIQKANVKVSLVDINNSDYNFKPDVKNQQIIFGMNAISGVGNNLVKAIIDNRPYTSLNDFIEKINAYKNQSANNKFGNTAIIALIKAGAFDEIEHKDRVEIMKEYVKSISNPLKSLSMDNIVDLYNLDLLTKEQKAYEYRLYKFKKYVLSKQFFVKQVGKSANTGYYYLEPKYAEPFFFEHFACNMQEDKDYEYNEEGKVIVKRGSLEREFNKLMQDFKATILSSKENLDTINRQRFQEVWDNVASGTISKWEMDSLSFYYHKHELADIDFERYNISNFEELPLTPEVVEYRKYKDREIPRFALTRICGTVLDKDKNKHIVTVLTPTGVVLVKFYKGQFNFYDRQISEVDENGKKTVLERSWFARGNKVLITGCRREDMFIPKKYKDSVYRHSLQLITGIEGKELKLQSNRIGEEEEEGFGYGQ